MQSSNSMSKPGLSSSRLQTLGSSTCLSSPSILPSVWAMSSSSVGMLVRSPRSNPIAASDDHSDPRRTLVQRVALLVREGVALTYASDAAERSRHVIQNLLDHGQGDA